MRQRTVPVVAIAVLLAVCAAAVEEDASMERPDADEAKPALATFAGGCFWCLEGPFEGLAGVTEATAGYTGGETADPTYREVCSGKTGHYEAVQVEFDPETISYERLLDVFWRQIDPTDPDGQFADRGSQYRTAIFFHDEGQREKAEASLKTLSQSERFEKPIVTRILGAAPFYPAEDEHQDYYRRCPVKYKSYRKGSGRQGFLEENWKDAPPVPETRVKPDDRTLREKLTPEQYRVTRENGTEPPFQNAFHDHREEGLYVDVVSGEALFSSKEKFDSGCGWPAFTRPVEGARLVEKVDRSHGMVRREVRSRKADSHLGHVFEDGPGPDGLRYCINSAALRFIPKDRLEEEGYGEYLELFE